MRGALPTAASASQNRTRALPAVGFIKPASSFSVVVLPAAFAPAWRRIRPRYGQRHVVDRDEVAESFGEIDEFDHGLLHSSSVAVRPPGSSTRKISPRVLTVNDHRLVQHARFQTVGRHRFTAQHQPFVVRLQRRFPASAAGVCGTAASPVRPMAGLRHFRSTR